MSIEIKNIVSGSNKVSLEIEFTPKVNVVEEPIEIPIPVTDEGKWESDEIKRIFETVLERTQIRIINTDNHSFWRDMRDEPFSEGLKGYGLSKLGWHSAFIRCDDADTEDLIDAKADIIMGMYYSPHNSDNAVNQWGDVPVMVIDGCVFGAYKKEIYVDGKMLWRYSPGWANGFWFHYNLETGEARSY